MTQIVTGDTVTITYKRKKFKAIVIDPNGLGKNKPSIGFGFRMMEKYTGLPQPTLSKWTTEESVLEGDSTFEEKTLETPSGNAYRVIQLLGNDNNKYQVIEASDWVDLIVDVLKKPGQLKKKTKHKLIEFLGWYAVEGLYAAAYISLKGNFTAGDEASLCNWQQAREQGIPIRNLYTALLSSLNCTRYEYAYWTNYIYRNLFGMEAKEMRKAWENVSGANAIARNHIQKTDGVKLVAYCEKMTAELYDGDLEHAHIQAIYFTQKNYRRGYIK